MKPIQLKELLLKKYPSGLVPVKVLWRYILRQRVRRETFKAETLAYAERHRKQAEKAWVMSNRPIDESGKVKVLVKGILDKDREIQKLRAEIWRLENPMELCDY